MGDSTGYGQSRLNRLMFDGDGQKYELWEEKFLAYMLLKDLKKTILPLADGTHSLKLISHLGNLFPKREISHLGNFFISQMGNVSQLGTTKRKNLGKIPMN